MLLSHLLSAGMTAVVAKLLHLVVANFVPFNARTVALHVGGLKAWCTGSESVALHLTVLPAQEIEGCCVVSG